MTVQEICAEIQQKQLYRFKAKSPLQIVRAQLRRHCQGLDLPKAPAQKCFKMTNDGEFELLDRSI